MVKKWGIMKNISHQPNGLQKYDVQLYLMKRQEKWFDHIKNSLKKAKTIKFDIKLIVKLQKETKPGENIYCSPCFRSNARAIVSNREITSILSIEIEKILDSYDSYMKSGSGWVLREVVYSHINIYKYQIWGGGGKKQIYRYYCLPKSLIKKRSCITVFPPTTDNKCFLYCVLASLFHKATPQHGPKNDLKLYQRYEELLNTRNISYPTKISEIPDFEKDNNLQINVVTVDGKGQNLRFLYKSTQKSTKKPINLLLYNKHFSLINYWSCFLNFSVSNRRKLCQECGNFYLSRLRKCSICSFETSCQSLKFMPKGAKQKFKNFKNCCFSNFVYYADIETEFVNVKHQTNSNTKKLKQHQPLAIGLYRVCTSEQFSHKSPILHIGRDCIKKFFKTLENEIDFIDYVQNTVNFPLHMSESANENFNSAKQCYVCLKNFTPELKKLRDHNHLKKIDNYRGAICNSCNLNRTDTEWSQTPIIFHNGSRYDSHFLLQNIHLLADNPTNVIGRSGENIMSFSLFKNRFKILDSINHLSGSLDKLVSVMKHSGKNFFNTKKVFGDDQTTQNLLCQKGFFPYNFLCLENLQKIQSIPNREKFHNDLTNKKITYEDYKHAVNVWRHMRCKNLQDYLEIYLATDITLLADVFENYRSFFYAKFNLDPTKYSSLPGLSYDCMMRLTGCEIDFIYDQEMFLFIRRALRGGLTNVNQKLAIGNNSFLQDYDPTKKTSYIIYLDINGLYSSTMTKKLPRTNLRWENFTLDSLKKTIDKYDSSNNVGYFIECDLKYPKEIHNLTKDLPLAPEHRIITENMMSPFSLNLKKKLKLGNEKIPKLVCTQFDKKNYVCHIENLKFYLKMGLKLEKVHKVLAFDQSAFLEPYIRFCMTERNKPGVTADERALFKLLSNSIFGKTILNPTRNTRINFVTDEKKLLKYVNRATFKHADNINNCVIQVTNSKKTSKITSPYFIGVAILELSKTILLKYHYDYFIAKYGPENISLLMSDTDSYIYHIKTPNLYSDLRAMNIIDFSNYPTWDENYNSEHSGEMFFLKDESAGAKIAAFVALKPKMYSLKFDQNSLNRVVGKGIPRNELQKITFNDMLEVLLKNIQVKITSTLFRSYRHLVYTVEQGKRALSPYDTKRYQIDGIYTLPFGHKDTLQNISKLTKVAKKRENPQSICHSKEDPMRGGKKAKKSENTITL